MYPFTAIQLLNFIQERAKSKVNRLKNRCRQNHILEGTNTVCQGKETCNGSLFNLQWRYIPERPTHTRKAGPMIVVFFTQFWSRSIIRRPARRALAILLLCSSLPVLYAGDIVNLRDKDYYGLGPHCDYLLDTGGALSISDVSSEPFTPAFTPSGDETLNFGYTSAALWLRVTLQDRSDHGHWALEVDNFDDVRVYLPDSHGGFREERFGRKTVQTNVLRRSGYSYVQLPCATDHPVTVFLRYHHQDTMLVHLSVVDMQAVLNTNQKELFYGVYFGSIAVMVLYNLLLFFLLRDTSYVFYVLYIVNMFFIQIVFSGIILDLMPPGSFFSADMVETVVIALALAFYLQFVRKFLISGLISPRIDRLLFVVSLAAAAHLPTIFFLPFPIRTLSLSLLFLVSIGLCFTVVIICLRKRYTPVYFFIASWFVLIAGVLAFVFRNINMLPNTFLTDNAMQMGSSLEAILLAFGLANRIHILQREKELAYEWSRLNQRKAEKLERDYRRLFETAPLGIALFDPEGNYLETNISYRRMYELEREELSGKNLFDTVYHEERREIEREQWKNMVSRSQPGISSFERTNLTASGNRINVRYFLNRTVNELGEPLGVLCCVEDITDLKKALHKLTDTIKEKDILLKEVHHRVKNNLQIIISLFRIKSREISDPAVEEILESTAGRIRTIANLHNRIYLSPDVAHVEADAFIRSTVKQTLSAFHFPDEKLEVNYDITPCT
ncbi:MAG TPA: PAS domain S-box protein, partial [Spirochaetia bacterium]|nr:PAS domain S-box protein [Spirochaetia bacterium]